VEQRDDAVAEQDLDATELEDVWPILSAEEKLEGFRFLDRTAAEDFFLGLSSREQADLLLLLPRQERRAWIRLMEPDDAADLLQEAPDSERDDLLNLLDLTTRREVTALLAYAEDEAGGLMSPRFARLRPEMSAEEAIRYLRRQAVQRAETIYYVYVLDPEQRLLGVVSFRDLFSSPPERRVHQIMETDAVVAPEEMDQEALAALFSEHDLLAVPVVDAERRVKGVVTVDDIVDVLEEEATEDIHKIGGTEALDAPYLQSGIAEMLRKRGPWLAVLFLGETLTAVAMGFYEDQIARAVVLALFIPLIISSGGNSGSQATTLVIRAMALGEVALRDWVRVLRREIATGLGLGLILGVLGLVKITVFQILGVGYGEFWLQVGFTVSISLIAVVLWGTTVGSMLPFILRRLRFDPASASAPFVATLVDVTGLIIYFSVASVLLRDMLS
jgi:magnesium transporter